MQKRKIKKLILLLTLSISPILIYASGSGWGYRCLEADREIASGIGDAPIICPNVPTCKFQNLFSSCHYDTNVVVVRYCKRNDIPNSGWTIKRIFSKCKQH